MVDTIIMVNGPRLGKRTLFAVLRSDTLGHLSSTTSYIANVANGRLLDADTGTIAADGTTVQLWAQDDADHPNRRWRIVHYHDDNWFIINVQNGRFLDADEVTIDGDGTKVQLWGTEQVENPNRLWKIQETKSSRDRAVSE